MYKVILFNGRNNGKWILRQTHESKGISQCGKYKFYVNEIIPDPDFVIVRGKALKTETVFHVAPENVILATCEPLSVLAYPKDYRNQFGLVCSCQETLTHKNVIFTPAILPWFAGVKFASNGTPSPIFDYDTLKSTPSPNKTKLISVISSNKAFTSGHLKRIRFVERLKEYYGDKIDVFGRGYNDFVDKLDVIQPYKYHIVIENTSEKYYWTEKLADCYIGESFPIYYGCTNISDYFPKESYKAIDINDFEGSVKIIDELIASDCYENTKSLLGTCKDLVLDDYNMFNYLARCLDNLNPDLPKKNISIKPANSMHDWHNVYHYLIERNIFKIKMFLKALINGKSILLRK